MGSAEVMSFQILFTPYGRVVVATRGADHHWLEVRLRERFRGRGYADSLIKAALCHIRGKHHLHFSPYLTCAVQAARTYKWTRMGKSHVFEHLEYYTKCSLRRAAVPFECRVVQRKTCPTFAGYRKNTIRTVLSLMMDT